MSSDSINIIERERLVIYQTYQRLPIVIERAEGVRVYGADGRSYLDMLSGIAVNSLGHSHPKILAAIERQARRYLHVSNFFYQDVQVKLAEHLQAISGYDKTIFTNSGAESWETAIKLARSAGSLRDRDGEIVAFKGGFHGRTYGALSLMDKPLYKKGMDPFLPSTRVLPFNDPAALKSAVNERTCAVGLEFIQGEGGVLEASTEFVHALFDARDAYGFVIIADEVQAGVGRTGDFFAFEKYGVRPDIVTMAKGLGGGLPLGAVLVSQEFEGVWQQGQHGSTYGGNALACAAGSVVMDEIFGGLLDHVREVGQVLHRELLRVQQLFPAYVQEVRGRGLFLGLSLSEDSSLLRDSLLDEGVISSATAGTVLRIVPALIISQHEIAEFIEKLTRAIQRRLTAR